MTQEESFAYSWAKNWDEMDSMGIRTARVRKQAGDHGALATAHRVLGGRQLSDGFTELKTKGRLDLSLEAMVLVSKWGSLFTDEEANEALSRLMEAGYHFLPRKK